MTATKRYNYFAYYPRNFINECTIYAVDTEHTQQFNSFYHDIKNDCNKTIERIAAKQAHSCNNDILLYGVANTFVTRKNGKICVTVGGIKKIVYIYETGANSAGVTTGRKTAERYRRNGCNVWVTYIDTLANIIGDWGNASSQQIANAIMKLPYNKRWIMGV